MLHSLSFLILLIFFFFFWYGALNSGLIMAKQVLCHLSHDSNPFACYFFEFLPGMSWTEILLPSAQLGSQACTTMPSLLVEMGSPFFPGLASNWELPDPHLHSWDYRPDPPHPVSFSFLGGTRVWTQGSTTWATHPVHRPVHFALVILEMEVSRTICLGWPWTSILLNLSLPKR
jgi:hypothetical protein